ncbi:hypothetical protein CQZ88_05725 [Rhodococcus sp. ENV425]|nr:hypothetical protein CQZ88_05725 [Rhodococcus sp. ENV425]
MGEVRKGRFAALILTGLTGTGVLGAGIARGELPMNVAITGQTFVGTMSAIEAQNVVIFPRRVDTESGTVPTSATRMESAQMTDVCLSTIARNLPIVGDVTMIVRVPGPNTTAQNVVLDAATIGASLDAMNVHAGVEASAIGGPEVALTPAVATQSGVMTNIRVEAVSMTATALTMKNFEVTVVSDSSGC